MLVQQVPPKSCEEIGEKTNVKLDFGIGNLKNEKDRAGTQEPKTEEIMDGTQELKTMKGKDPNTQNTVS